MHFYDDGLFVGQFGEASPGHSCYEGVLPGFAGNGHCPTLTKTQTGDYYVWVNDESGHGPQRWHLVNARNVREQTGVAALGGTFALTGPPASFPTDVAGVSGNGAAFLSWNSVSNAALYNIYYSSINGGPHTSFVGSTAATKYVVQGLTNGTDYYFAIFAVIDGAQGIASEQAEVRPFDTNQAVVCSGSMSEGGQATPIVEISSAALTSGQPGWVGSEHLAGVLSLGELCYYGYGDLTKKSIGGRGYCLFDWGGPGSNVIHLPTSFTVKPGLGWADLAYLKRQFKVDSVLGTNAGLVANPVGTFEIGVNDDNYHFLTVASPAKFNDPRKFTLGITSTNGTSAQYSVNELHGNSRLFQFLFKGNVTLRADGTGGGLAIIQAIFLDDAPGNNFSRPSPPTGLRSEGTVP
jgi:hypothetical protein